ncbi:putative WRKY transcription factor 38 [Hordeum vulgare]|nr:putative WRKY transcription factor 38 [Hordeum vulgare]
MAIIGENMGRRTSTGGNMLGPTTDVPTRNGTASATKTIQRQDHNGSLNCEDETAKYIVVYYGHHSCRADITRNVANIDPSVDLIQSGKMAGAVTDFEKFDQQDLDVSSLIEVFDNPELNWDIIC